MLRSEENPEDESFIQRLIPTGSISMVKSLQQLKGSTAAKKMEYLYGLVKQLTQTVKVSKSFGQYLYQENFKLITFVLPVES